MDTVRVAIDAMLFDDDTVARAMHRYTGDFFADFSRSDAGIEVRLTPMGLDVDTSNLAQRFANDLLDERLRAKIRAETGALHAIFVQAALREASSPESAAEPVGLKGNGGQRRLFCSATKVYSDPNFSPLKRPA